MRRKGSRADPDERAARAAAQHARRARVPRPPPPDPPVDCRAWTATGSARPSCRSSRSGGTPRPVLVADPAARVGAPAHERRHEPVHPVLPRAGRAAVPARRHRPEVLPHQRHRERGPRRAAPHVLRDARQLLVRRLLQGRVDRVGARAGHRGLRRRARPAVGHRLRRRRRGGRGLGRRRRASPRTGSSAAARSTPRASPRTTGTRTPPGPPGPAARSSSTAARRTDPTADPTSTRSASWRSGTSCSCRTRSTATSTIVAPLPGKNVDTGSSLERVATVLQGVDDVFETDLFRPTLEVAERLSGKQHGAGPARRRLAQDHRRARPGDRRS